MTPILHMPLAIALFVFFAWTYLAWWFGWKHGQARGNKEGWLSCKQFLAEHPEYRDERNGAT